MPGYKAHVVGGVVSFALIAHLFTISRTAFMPSFFLCLLGSLFPDIDIKSKGQRIFYMLWVITLFSLLWQKQYQIFSIISLLGAAPLLVAHRGVFHAPWFLCMLAGGMYGVIHMYLPTLQPYAHLYASSFLVGSLSHIFLDRFVSRFKRRRF